MEIEIMNRICVLLEALSIVLCLHKLYGEKFRLDLATICLFVTDMVMMTAIDYFHLPSILSIMVYMIIAVYCGIKFGFKWKIILVNSLLYLAIISSLQTFIMLLGHYIFCVDMFIDWRLLIMNCILIVIMLLLPRKKLQEISIYLQDKERILIISLIVSIVVTVYCIVVFKKITKVELGQTMLLFVCIIFIVMLVVQLNKYRIKAKEIEIELKMHRLYEDSFQGLIQDIRLRQHEFDNHINTIFSQHFLCHTYEDLVNVQRNYCEIILEENHYNKLLSCGNSILVGFLYGKFVEIDKRDIGITYKVSIRDFEIGVPVYKIVETLGDLINNAVEAMEVTNEGKKLFVSIVENDEYFEIEVRNVSESISLDEIHKFFDKGYSKKGDNRGLGLYNVKRICEEYEMEIHCYNKNIDGENWLSFVITGQKQTK